VAHLYMGESHGGLL